MHRLILVVPLAVSLLSVFAVSRTASASGACFWWWRLDGVKHYSYYDCAHPTKPPWQGGPGNPSPGGTSQQPTHSPAAQPPSAPPPSTTPSSGRTFTNTYPWGQCTWWAAQTKLHENLGRLGNAGKWAINARSRGLLVGATPRVGATAVFAPGVQGASLLGHVAHVVAVSGGRFKVSEMNFYGGSPHGGFGKVDDRWAHTGSGVSFIY